MGKLIKSKWFKPYTVQSGVLKPSLKLPNKKFQTGVYLIKSIKSNKVVYVGYSKSNIHRTIYRHFQVWNDIRERKVYNKTGYLIRIIFCVPTKADRLEKYLIQKFNPRDNNFFYDDVLSNSEVEKTQETYATTIYAAPNEDIPF